MKKTFMSEGVDDVEGSKINSVFYMYRSVKNGIHYKHEQNVHNNINNRKQHDYNTIKKV